MNKQIGKFETDLSDKQMDERVEEFFKDISNIQIGTGTIGDKFMPNFIRKLAYGVANLGYHKVIKCKDCVYSYFNPSSERYTCDRQYPRRHVEEDDFCNYAKMKGGAE